MMKTITPVFKNDFRLGQGTSGKGRVFQPSSPLLPPHFGRQDSVKPVSSRSIFRQPLLGASLLITALFITPFSVNSSPIDKEIDVSFENTVPTQGGTSSDKQRHITMTLIPESEDHLKMLAEQVSDSFSFEHLFEILKAAVFKESTKFVFFDTKTAENPKDEEQVQRVSAQNTTAMINAFKAKLTALDEEVTQVTVVLPETLPEGVDAQQLIREMATLSVLKGYNYNFDRTRSGLPQLASVVLNHPSAKNSASPVLQETFQEAIREGRTIGEAMNLVRHLVDSGANRATTGYFTRKALALASDTMTVQVLKGDDLEGKTEANDKRMGLFLAVAKGNDRDNPEKEPRLLEMVHTPENWDSETGKTIMLVGKGVMFDTGGSTLKSKESSHNQRGDMGGAAAVLGLMKVLDELPMGIRVVALMPLTENRIGRDAILPQDVKTARSGNTVYISSTDAEGRLIMADAMNYGLEERDGELDAVLTIATLTGGKVRYFGRHNAVGISGNNEPFLEQLNKVIHGQLRRTTKGVYPLDQRHYTMVTNSSPADVQNSSNLLAREFAGLINPEDIVDPSAKGYEERYNLKGQDDSNLAAFMDGAAFIQAVAMDPHAKATQGSIPYNIPWGHLDIAGSQFGPADPELRNHEWATGIGVEELYYSIKGIAEGAIKPSADATKLPEFEKPLKVGD